MRHRSASVIGLLVLSLLTLLAGWSKVTVPAVSGAPVDPTLLASVTGSDPNPQTNGRIIAYSRRQGSYDIYGVGVQGGQPFPIATGNGDQVLEGISGDWVLWYELSDTSPSGAIRATKLTDGSVVDLASTNILASAAISGDWTIWMSYSGRREVRQTQLFARNLATLSPARLLATVPPGIDVWPMISGERVVWVEWEEPGAVLNGPQTQHWRLRELRLNNPKPFTLTEGSETSNCTRMSGDTVGCALQSGSMIGVASLGGSTLSYVETMYDGRKRSVIRDLDSGRITIVAGEANEVVSDDHYAFWSGATEQPSQIHAFDLTTGQSLTLVDDAGLNLTSSRSFNVGSGWLVWLRAPGDYFSSKQPTLELHAVRLDDLLAASSVASIGNPTPALPLQVR